jgi:hypothetical protein
VPSAVLVKFSQKKTIFTIYKTKCSPRDCKPFTIIRIPDVIYHSVFFEIDTRNQLRVLPVIAETSDRSKGIDSRFHLSDCFEGFSKFGSWVEWTIFASGTSPDGDMSVTNHPNQDAGHPNRNDTKKAQSNKRGV